MKSSLRAFGIGLFVAGATLGIVHATTKEQPTQQTAASTQTTDNDAAVAGQLKALQQQKSALEQENEALEQRINKLEKKLKQQQTTEVKPTTETKPTTNSTPTYTLHIASGMGTTEITDTLKKAGIISNAREFEQYIIDKGQATKLQNGSFSVNKNMSYEEILRVLIQ